ncbi:MAG: NAD(P)/FAD-dependent oxidoreductase [Shimia sp.]
MPFEDVYKTPRRKVAVIGAGISGLSAAHLLGGSHDVTLFEAERRLGGHARTIHVGHQPVDTGFLVFNHSNYPHLTALFHDLAVPTERTCMSFGASIGGGAFEYGILSRSAIFAQKRNVLRPRFWQMLRQMIRFGKEAEAWIAAQPAEITIAEMVEGMHLGPWFRDRYLLPMTGAIWSTPFERVVDFPAHALVTFFKNHGLLIDGEQHPWYTVAGGSIEYVRRLQARLQRMGVTIRAGAPTAGVRRTALGVEVRAEGAEWEAFDEVVFATHSDDTLAMLSDARPEERAALSAVAYQPNEAITHSDSSAMAKRRAVWGAWNYTEDGSGDTDRIDLTYWINKLQNIPGPRQYFVTLNTKRPLREELIHDVCTFRHPVFDAGALHAQRQITGFNGTQNTWFCGAWMKNGFHEDGISSAVDVATAMQDRAAARLAAQ